MSDITMCEGDCCPLKDTCRRHTATPTPMLQSYFVITPNEGEHCGYYWGTPEPEEKKD